MDALGRCMICGARIESSSGDCPECSKLESRAAIKREAWREAVKWLREELDVNVFPIWKAERRVAENMADALEEHFLKETA